MKVSLFARSLLVAALAAAGGVSVVAHEAHATTFAKLSLEQYVDASTFIVRGTVTEVWTTFDEGDLVWTHARVRVAETFKGPGKPRELVVSSLGGEHEGYVLQVVGAAQFSVGEENLLFLTEAGPKRYLVPVGKFNGKYIIRRAPGEDASYAMTFQADRALAYDARFLPHPQMAYREDLDGMIERIRARVAEGWDGHAIPGLSSDRLTEINQLERRIAR